ncbi:MAG: hypothetical protein COB77_00580 [Gammaproteobacteria bacterium]|nr:MAG: hypothetical protein COB77_00580 [Gammaproteobacteria bacterium]
MNKDMRIGAVVGARDLLIIKSILNLHPEEWVWVDSSSDADIWINDLTVVDSSDPIYACCSIGLIKDAAPDVALHHTLKLPLRALDFSKLLDDIMESFDFSRARKQQSKGPKSAPPVQKKTAQQVTKAAEVTEKEAPVEDVNPWEGLSIMLSQEPNYSAFPITAELMIWIETMLDEPVSYDDMYEDLEYDRELLIAVLNDAAHHGHLIDSNHAAVAEYIKPKSQGAFAKLWGR